MEDKKAIKYEFKIPRLGRDGKPLKKETGEPVLDVYIYNFEEMGMDRKLMAKKFYFLSSKNLANQPKEPEHIEILADRRMEIKAFSAILIKKLDDETYESYDPAKTELTPYAMSELGKSTEDWNKLMECQEDFFLKVGLQSVGLMTQSNGIMMQSLNIMKELTNLAGATGIESMAGMKDFMALILDKALSVNTEM